MVGLVFTMAPTVVTAQPSVTAQTDALAQACPGAAAWLKDHAQSEKAMQERDDARSPTDAELLAEILRRTDRDQEARHAYISGGGDPRAASRVEAIDEDNFRWFSALVKRQGFPSVAQVGEVGVHRAWLLVQHSDAHPEFRAALLPVLTQRYAAGEFDATDLAKVIDRSLKRAGKPQRFGTQFDWMSRHFQLPGETELRRFDSNREQLHLMSLEDYACFMNQQLAELNRSAD